MPRTKYKLKDGTEPPGVTTILGTIGYGKNNIIRWSNALGLSGLNQQVELQRMADIGSCAHDWFEATLTGSRKNVRDWPQEIEDAAQLPYQAFQEWRKGKRIKVVASEFPVVSEEFRCGGTPDGIIRIDDGPHVLIDYKTSSYLYETHIAQVSAYVAMIKHHYNRTISSALILRFGKDGVSEELEVSGQMLADGLELFQIALRLYRLESEMKKHLRTARPITVKDKPQLPTIRRVPA